MALFNSDGSPAEIPAPICPAHYVYMDQENNKIIQSAPMPETEKQ